MICGISRPACAQAPSNVKVVHVFVALADNAHQGIIPVPKALGNGDDPDKNLYWGAAFGVRTYFRNSSEWKQVSLIQNPEPAILERLVLHHRERNVYIIADAYRGSEIQQAIADFFRAASGHDKAPGNPPLSTAGRQLQSDLATAPQLVAYVGHDGLMDFVLKELPSGSPSGREAIVLACASKSYFRPGLQASGAQPLLWTTNLMAPEAYTLKAAIDGWIAAEKPEAIRRRAANAYAKYQKISEASALRLFATGW